MRKRLLFGLLTLAVLATPGYGGMQFSTALPDSGLTDHSFVDIMYHDGVVWVASGNGLSLSTDGGQSWFTHSSSTGMNSDEPSAMFGRPGQIWVAGSHFEEFQGFQFPFGNGIDMSINGGIDWVSITPPEASNFAKVAYDLDGDLRSTYAASFHGGLIVTHDDGVSWQHLFYSPPDSSDWAADDWADLESGRYYSCAVDTFHADTGVVYGGTAAGIHKFLRIPKRVKLGGDNIQDILAVDSFIYLTHENGISQAFYTQTDSTTALTNYYTADTLNGLGGLKATRLAYFGDILWTALFDQSDTTLRTGLGLYFLNRAADVAWTEMEASIIGPSDLWSKHPATFFEGVNGGVFDFKAYGDSIFFIAAGDSGVFHSLDSGQTWQRFYSDSTNMSQDSLRNQVYSIDMAADSIFLGTKAGLVRAPVSLAPFVIGADTLLTFAESDSTGSFVSLVRRNDGTGDSSFTWLGVEPIDPQSGSGDYTAIMLDTNGVEVIAFFIDDPSAPRAAINNIIVTYSSTFLATDIGLFLSPNPPVFIPGFEFPPIKFAVQDTTTGLTLNSFRFHDVEFVGKRLFTSSSDGFGFNVDTTGGKLNDWRLFRANTNPLAHDLAVARTVDNSDLPGDWVVAMNMQVTRSDTVLWAATRRVPTFVGQETGVAFSLDFGDTWNVVLENMQVWNFAFDQNGVTYAAASEGLFYASPPWDDWQRAVIIDHASGDTIVDGTEIFAVETADSILWIGTSLGLARRPIDDQNGWAITRIFKATEMEDEVFAAPVPFSPINFNGRLSVHYHVTNSSDVTVEIYDFSMNLVKRLTDGKPRAGGSDYFESWDGFNDRGDMAATGIYYIKVSYSTGEEKWGRLAIIP